MDIAIISRGESLYSTRRLVESTYDHGHKVQVINPLTCLLSVSNGTSSVHNAGRDLGTFDIVIPRIGPSAAGHGLALVRQLESTGAFCLNGSEAIARARDKLRSLQVLSAAGIRVPRTAFSSQMGDADRVLDLVGGLPVVIKLLNSSQGAGVMLAETRHMVKSVLDSFYSIGQSVLVQEFVGTERGVDIRAFVVGGELIATIRRRAEDGEFRANVHRGGAAELVRPDREMKRTALEAVQSVGLDICGLDMVETKDGPVVLEANVSPGLEAIETTTGVDVASRVIQHAVERRIRSLR
jgi:ribosomal protein S6--L-glutamate ligase